MAYLLWCCWRRQIEALAKGCGRSPSCDCELPDDLPPTAMNQKVLFLQKEKDLERKYVASVGNMFLAIRHKKQRREFEKPAFVEVSHGR